MRTCTVYRDRQTVKISTAPWELLLTRAQHADAFSGLRHIEYAMIVIAADEAVHTYLAKKIHRSGVISGSSLYQNMSVP